MRAIRFARRVAKELIREITIAELGCKGQDLTSLGGMGQGSLPLLTVTEGDTAILLSAMPMLKYWTRLPSTDYKKLGVNNEQGENK